MAKRLVTLPNFNSVGVGQRATLGLPVGARKYHKVVIQYKGGTDNQATIEAALKTLRVVVNGKAQRECLVSDINMINAYRGRAFQTGTVIIYLADPGARTMTGEELVAWGTSNLSTLQIEIDIDVAAVAPALSAWAEIEDVEEPLGLIMKLVKNPGYNVAGANTLPIRDLRRDPQEAYGRLHIQSALATHVRVKADSDEIFELVPRSILAAHYAGRPQATIMQANVLTVDFAASTQITDFLPMLRSNNRLVQDFPVEVTLSGAATFSVLAEIYGPAL